MVDVQNSTSTVRGQITMGEFSKEFAISPDGCTVLVSECGSKAVQAVDVSTLP